MMLSENRIIEVERLSDKELVAVINDPGDQHGIPNLIAKLAIKKSYVSYAAYLLDHPLVSRPRVVIVTDGSKNPLDVLLEILEEAKNYVEDLKEELEKIL